jgi:hypothetical protein
MRKKPVLWPFLAVFAGLLNSQQFSVLDYLGRQELRHSETVSGKPSPILHASATASTSYD